VVDGAEKMMLDSFVVGSARWISDRTTPRDRCPSLEAPALDNHDPCAKSRNTPGFPSHDRAQAGGGGAGGAAPRR
jgi:hypothetical protein